MVTWSLLPFPVNASLRPSLYVEFKVAYYSFQWRKSALFQSCQKCQKGFSFGLLITLTAIRNEFHPKKKFEKLRTC